jgi:Aspartyl protease
LPFFTLQVSPNGPLLDAFVGVSHARLTALQAHQQAVPQAVPIRALVDTGASCTCVDPSVLTALGLTPTGVAVVNTPSTGSTPHSTFQYDVSLAVPPALPTHTLLVVPNLPVVASQLLQAQGFHALLGRDVLSLCRFTYDGLAGFFTLVY